MLIIKKHLLGTELNGVTVSKLQEEFHRPSHCEGNGLGIFMINFCTWFFVSLRLFNEINLKPSSKGNCMKINLDDYEAL